MREKRKSFTSHAKVFFPPFENLLPPPPIKIPLSRLLRLTKYQSPTKQQFSSDNPIKTEFLAVVIVPVPFLF